MDQDKGAQPGNLHERSVSCAGEFVFDVLDLFSGAGAYSLGLERTGGFRTVAFCEIEPYPRERILRKNWPLVPIFEDVRALTADTLRRAGIVPNWIVAGWPCQGNSLAGTGLGMDDPRSGLWSEIKRLAGEIRPIGLLLENSSNLLAINDGRDFGTVLGDLAALGYDAEWHCLSAAAFDAPHIRDRVWIIATLADASWHERGRQERRPKRERARARGQSVTGPDPRCQGLERHRRPVRVSPQKPKPSVSGHGGPVAYANSLAPIGTAIARQERRDWEPESRVARVAARVADRVDRIRALGNLNPPIIPEMIGRAILTALSDGAPTRHTEADVKGPGMQNQPLLQEGQIQ